MHFSYYVGQIVDVQDPEYRGRIRCIIPNMIESDDVDKLPWAEPFLKNIPTLNSIDIPHINDHVYILINGNRYCEQYYMPIKNLSQKTIDLLKTSYEDAVIFIEKKIGDKEITAYVNQNDGLVCNYNDNSIIITPDNKINISQNNGTEIDIDSNGNFTLQTKNGKTAQYSLLGEDTDNVIKNLCDNLVAICNQVAQLGNTSNPAYVPMGQAVAGTVQGIKAQVNKIKAQVILSKTVKTS